MFIAAMSTTAIIWKEPRCPLTDEWIKMWYVYTMDYYSAIKTSEILPFAMTWMENKMKTERGANHKTLLTIGNKLRIAGGEGGERMG